MAEAKKQSQAPEAPVLLQISVPVSPGELAYLERDGKGKNAAERLAAFTKWFITRQAGGGLMLEPQDMDYLAELNKGQRFETSRDVVKAVEVALKRDDGQFTFPIQVQPELMPALEENAKYSSATVEEFLQHVGNEVLKNGWFMYITPESGALVPFDKAELLAARKLLGKFNFTGQDLVKAITAASENNNAKVA